MLSKEGKAPRVPLGSFAFGNPSTNGYGSDLSNDKIGEELSPEASIWKMYLNQADEYDQELVKGWNSNLDMLLLFAALFSAIVRAFIIEAKDLLQQDPADVSMGLLLAIAQSQHRVELGIPIPPDSESPAVPDFVASATARWINGFWFISLGLSISASLIAMLSKEWLNSYLAMRPGTNHTRVLNRQARFEGLKRWWATHIIALLPSFLHAALLLFSIGLVIYLWALDHTIAISFAILVGATSIFYVGTAIIGAIYEFCPFVTEFSGYVRKGVITLFRKDYAKRSSIPGPVSFKNTQALLWLIDHARDPVLADCGYQALAGLYRRIAKNIHSKEPPNLYAANDAVDEEDAFPAQLTDNITPESLLATLTDRFKRLTIGSLNPTSGSTTSAARYVIAILGVSAHAYHSRVVESKKHTEKQHERFDIISNMVTSANFKQESAFDLLESIEVLWSGEILRLEPNAYATILIATMDIILSIASSIPDTAGGFHSADETELSGQNPNAPDNPHVVDFAAVESTHRVTAEHQLRTLRTYYSRWLLRVSYLLQVHASDKNPMQVDQEPISLLVDHEMIHRLLDTLTHSTRYAILNPIEAISTHHIPDEIPSDHAYSFILQDKNRGSWSEIQSGDLHKGPLGAIIELLRKRPGLKDKSSVEICFAALQAYAALSPIILAPVLGLPRDKLAKSFDMDSWPYVPQKDMMGLRYIAARFALLTARYLGLSHKRTPRLFRFCDSVFGLLKFCLEQDESYRFRANSYSAITHHSTDLIPLLQFAGESEPNRSALSAEVGQIMLNVAGVQTTSHGVTACDNSLTPQCFPALIYMIRWSDSEATHIERLFQAMVRRMRADGSHVMRQKGIPWNNIPAIQYLYQFTRSKQGFMAMLYAARIPMLPGLVASTLVDIVHLAAGQDTALKVEPVELELDTVPSFLDAISDTVRYYWSISYQEDQLVQLSTDLLILLKAVVNDDAAKEAIRQHSSYANFLSCLRALNAHSKSDFPREHRMKVWGGLQDLIGPAAESRREDNEPRVRRRRRKSAKSQDDEYRDEVNYDYPNEPIYVGAPYESYSRARGSYRPPRIVPVGHSQESLFKSL